nr:immunoglobulin heavy chain junction region [Macaca mulatta]MOV37992.1 immunoglobulin heavy chain junction region [Macaca mulatta]MOV38528.1 immunoglobulin heavy chain junction region [Macaca mulatta]MOV39438.1 immunoglobulin heavy chain junction region [Macaca mulatta]MOV39495.1 immunoglobulin heavy chain junction region [Macaca mulatta]
CARDEHGSGLGYW